MQEQKTIPISGIIIAMLVIANILLLKAGFIYSATWYGGLVVTIPLLLVALAMYRKRNAPSSATTRELMEACGFANTESVKPTKFFRRMNEQETKSFEQIYFPEESSARKGQFHSLLN